VEQTSSVEQGNFITPKQCREYVEVAAYYLYLDRLQAGTDGTPEQDWLLAEIDIESDYAIKSGVPTE
jgi:hypothetical protein